MKKQNDRAEEQIYIDPVNLFVVIIAAIFVATALADLILSILPSVSIHTITVYRFAFLNAGLTIVILFPVVYYLVFKPFTSYIEQLKRSKKALQTSEGRYRSLVETTDDSIFLVNKDCKYLFMNTKHLSRLGFSVAEAYAGRAYSEFHSPEETEIFRDRVKEVFETGLSLQHEHRSGRDGKYFLRTLSPVRGPDRTIEAVSVVSKNITQVKEAALQKGTNLLGDPR
ncbi:MAG TPA: PAS domain-containing protein [Thermodesulfovibrionales bacterium]|nr:PAS domain-containing protein [Thermodesulfovibrionales bacterium]